MTAMLEASHNHWLIAASLAVAMMSGFTGLSLLKGASQISAEKRKFNVALASIAMGGGIWSMHFVAMLGVQLPTPFFYDILPTLASALIAILVVGMALLILHFVRRDRKTMISAGILVGFGIIIMHYLGMSGMQGAIPQYSVPGVLAAIAVSAGLGIITFLAAYGERKLSNILLGTVFFGIAVFTVHFVAMASTTFIAGPTDAVGHLLISNEILAIGVSMTTFVICGAFLLTGVTFISPAERKAGGDEPTEAVSNPQATPSESDGDLIDPASSPPVTVRVPYEKDGRSLFVQSDRIAAIRAEGHYSVLYTNDEKLFCPWSISEISKRLSDTSFINCHRSYLINPALVSEFERKKDNGVCYFSGNKALEKVPVSRSKLKLVREALGLA